MTPSGIAPATFRLVAQYFKRRFVGFSAKLILRTDVKRMRDTATRTVHDSACQDDGAEQVSPVMECVLTHVRCQHLSGPISLGR